MAEAPDKTGVTVHEMTRDEGLEMLDKLARRYLNISADEFIQAWESGMGWFGKDLTA